MDTTGMRERILERLGHYSDRFREEGPCGADASGCSSPDCASRRRHYTDKALYHTYGGFYADLIPGIAEVVDSMAVMELGTARGGSLLAWLEAIPGCRVVGVDRDLSQLWIDPGAHPALTLLSGSHEEPSTYEPIGDMEFDLIIDDGSHLMGHQIQNFGLLRGRLRPGAAYVIEDVYPEHDYPADFLALFERHDFSGISGRGDDVILVHRSPRAG